jgi:hypothetical protein
MHLKQFFTVIIIAACLQGCSSHPCSYSGGFVAGGMFARFDSRSAGNPISIIYAQAEPTQSAGPGGGMGGGINGDGYFTFDDGRTVRYTLTDSATVTIGGQAVKLAKGRLLKAFVSPNGSVRVEQDSLDAPLAQTIIRLDTKLKKEQK